MLHDSSGDDSSDDEKSWVKEVRRNYRTIKHNERIREQENAEEDGDNAKNESNLEQIKNDVRLEEGEPGKKKQNK